MCCMHTAVGKHLVSSAAVPLTATRLHRWWPWAGHLLWCQHWKGPSTCWLHGRGCPPCWQALGTYACDAAVGFLSLGRMRDACCCCTVCCPPLGQPHSLKVHLANCKHWCQCTCERMHGCSVGLGCCLFAIVGGGQDRPVLLFNQHPPPPTARVAAFRRPASALPRRFSSISICVAVHCIQGGGSVEPPTHLPSMTGRSGLKLSWLDEQNCRVCLCCCAIVLWSVHCP